MAYWKGKICCRYPWEQMLAHVYTFIWRSFFQDLVHSCNLVCIAGMFNNFALVVAPRLHCMAQDGGKFSLYINSIKQFFHRKCSVTPSSHLYCSTRGMNFSQFSSKCAHLVCFCTGSLKSVYIVWDNQNELRSDQMLMQGSCESVGKHQPSLLLMYKAPT